MINIIQPILISLFIIIWILDLLVLSFLVPLNYAVDSKYYRFHQKYGVKRTSILKLVFGLPIIAFMWESPLNIEVVPIVLTYCAYMALLLYRLWSIFPDTIENHSKKPLHPLDSLIGFLIYPFDYLDTNKPIFRDQSEKFRWSWGAFWLPELWYFKNELLGAGYISLLLLFIYLGLFVALGKESLLFILFIRIISGLYGQRVFFAKYGQGNRN